ncbi:MAG: 30S ribosomal protein S4 [Patescibacteria group bacterium]
MKIGPRYKKARYLGAPVFHKTQTQKYAMRAQRKTKTVRRGQKSEYGRQMMEKQKARFSYGISGTQFTKYVKKALATPGDNGKNLMKILEGRLDNAVLRIGFAPSRSAARQMVSHGHIKVNNIIVTIPSYNVRVGDIITIRDGSKNKGIFAKFDENIKAVKIPAWLSLQVEKREAKVEGEPTIDMSELLFDVRQVLEFYTR